MMKQKRKRLWALLLSTALIVMQLPAVAMAENDMPEDDHIASFEPLDRRVKKQTVTVGTELSELILPDMVTASVYHVTEDMIIEDEDSDIPTASPSEADDIMSGSRSENSRHKDSEKTVTTVTTTVEKIPVTWDSEPAYDGGVEGRYIFTADLDGYALSEKAKLPQITVVVEEYDTAYTISTPTNATFANVDFKNVLTDGSTERAEAFATFINTFDHGGSGNLTATATGNTVLVAGSVTGATKSLLYVESQEKIIIDWRADYEGNDSAGGLLSFYGSDIQFNMNGGNIIRSGSSDFGAYALIFSSCQVSLNDGMVQGALGIHIGDGTLDIENGAVISALDIAVYSRGSHIEMTGGTLSASAEGARGIYLSENSELTMTDGSISADGKHGYALFAGLDSVVNIEGGTISAVGPGGRAVYTNRNREITIANSDISLSGLWVNETEASIDETGYMAMVVLPNGTPLPTEADAINIVPKDAGASVSIPHMIDEHTWLFTIESGCLRQSYLVELFNNPVKISPATVDFGRLTVGSGTLPVPQTITIENTGTIDIDGFTVSDGVNYNIIWKDSQIPQGGSVTITVQPKSGLKEGVWRETIIISADGSVMAKAEAAIEIIPASGRSSRSSSSEGSATDSSVLTGTWERTDTGFWKFRLATGRYAANRWGMADGGWYYFDAEGIMLTGWQHIGEEWYYLSTKADTKTNTQTKEGAMVIGWYYDPMYGGWFYLGTNGAMATGSREIDGKTYYFNPEPDGRQGILSIGE